MVTVQTGGECVAAANGSQPEKKNAFLTIHGDKAAALRYGMPLMVDGIYPVVIHGWWAAKMPTKGDE